LPKALNRQEALTPVKYEFGPVEGISNNGKVVMLGQTKFV
jgi:hypothetical protein